jgi:UDP-N-acetylmuramoylalanine--D-glutamate ligase
VEAFKGQVLVGAQDMGEIIKQANSLAAPGDVVLLSPGAASFGMFKDSKDRGAKFNQAVQSL